MNNSRRVVKNSEVCWYKSGSTCELHRDEIDPETGLSLPAFEDQTGYKSWFVDGKRHRLDGPAIQFPENEYDKEYTQYWINGKHIPKLDGKHIYGKEKLVKLLMLI
jgi:hypothetical protein